VNYEWGKDIVGSGLGQISGTIPALQGLKKITKNLTAR
jgi:hypothetical protein